MDYTCLIEKNKQYKYSANVCFDLHNAIRLSNYIPNETTTAILREYLGGIIKGNANTHSRILYGSYGTGKSHLLTVMGAVLGHFNTSNEEFFRFVDMIDKYDAELAFDLRNFAREETPFLIVPIYTDYPDFASCVLYSLKKELEANRLEVTFSGFFNDALSLLRRWMQGGESKERLEEECRKISITASDLARGIEAYDAKYEKPFRKIYGEMSYGAEFNATVGGLLENLDKANAAIEGRYRGIVFIFDEFGRYIEDNNEIRVKDVQDMAEYCDHSNYDNHLILVSHKQLSMYTEGMKKSLSDEWKKVEGRFKPTLINIKYDQCLSLIGNIIPKTGYWNDFKNIFEKELNKVYNQGWDFKGFLMPMGDAEEKQGYLEAGYPLHPITLFALDRLSKRVAQNERTYFTYLVGEEEHSLTYQLKQYDINEFHFIGLDAIFDYFESNIRTYKSDEAYEVYKKLQQAINKIDDDPKGLQEKILKAMAVIFIIADNSLLSADRDTLMQTIDELPENISNAIDMLEQKKIIKFMRQYGYYDYFDSSIFDIESMIEEKIAGVSDEMVVTVLNEDFSDFVIYPHAYNEKFHMNRVFFPVFVRKDNLGKKYMYSLVPKYYDGVVAFVLDNDFHLEDYNNARNIPDRTILHINGRASILEQEVRRYLAIRYYYSMKTELEKDDPTVTKELELYLDEQRTIIHEQIRNWRNYRGKEIFTILDGELQEVSSEVELSNLATKLMFKKYAKTIIVNNDMLNKNRLSGAIKQARKKALAGIMSKGDMYSGCAPLSPESNVIRSVLSMNGIGSDVGIPENRMNYLEDGTLSGNYVMGEIHEFLKKAASGQKELSEIYEKLKQEPYGLRDGYIPVLLAYALREYQNVSLYFHGTERDYTEEELTKALSEPENYTVYICNWEDDKKRYIENLEQLFKDYLVPAKDSNRLKYLYEAMNSHYASLSKSARTTKRYVSDEAMKYRDILNVTHTDYNKFFFETLNEIDSDAQGLRIRIENIKKELEGVPAKLIERTEKAVRNFFEVGYDSKISSKLKELYRTSWEEKSTKAFDYCTNAFLEYVAALKDEDDSEVVKELAKLLTGFEIEFWTDDKINEFVDLLEDIVKKLNNYEPSDQLEEGDVKVTIEYGQQTLVTARFMKEELSTNGQMMLSKLKSTINNFGESISYEEKLNVISQIFRESIG